MAAIDWKVAPALDQLLDQLNKLAPSRSKVADGAIGDADHADRASDHNPHWSFAGQPYVTARDYTQDPRGGLDCAQLAAALRDGKDQRVRYVIWNDKIMSGFGGPAPWVWRAYRPGDPKRNQHRRHLHLSVVPDARSLVRIPWLLPGLGKSTPAAVLFTEPQKTTTSRPTIRLGDRGTLVGIVQRYLGVHPVDEAFGPVTLRAVIAYQKMRGLKADGRVGPATWGEMQV